MHSIEDVDRGTAHELVRVIRDPAVGLSAVIAIHSTALGPSMGGVRRRDYASFDAAIEDALRLSEAMTLKNSAAGLPLGGGKAVIIDAAESASPELIDAFATVLQELGGRYVAAEDIGTTPADMDRIARRTTWVAGQSEAAGGNGDPSPATAVTVFGALRAAAQLRWGSDDLHGRTVGILGAGKVGSHLATHVAAAGASVMVADVRSDRAEAVATAVTDGVAVSPAALLDEQFDVLAPCATGGLLTSQVAEELRVEIVCGAANNMLSTDAVADVLKARDVLYVPDFLANAGGIIHVGGAFLGWAAERIRDQLDDCVANASTALREAQHAGVTPLTVALRRAAARLRAAEPSIRA
jgi:glutamate dehydrogenase/leucine dehydrogenase